MNASLTEEVDLLFSNLPMLGDIYSKAPEAPDVMFYIMPERAQEYLDRKKKEKINLDQRSKRRRLRDEKARLKWLSQIEKKKAEARLSGRMLTAKTPEAAVAVLYFICGCGNCLIGLEQWDAGEFKLVCVHTRKGADLRNRKGWRDEFYWFGQRSGTPVQYRYAGL